MNRTNVDILIAHLEACPPESIEMKDWMNPALRAEYTAEVTRNPRATWITRERWLSTHEFPEGYCGTACCLAGHCVTVMPVSDRVKALRESELRDMETVTMLEARTYEWCAGMQWLGLTPEQADDLFTPDTWIIQRSKPEDAIATLKRLRETGEVDWGMRP